ncbi:hypothetical protein EDC96DRAFT_491610 [Choanephora cucurbitarum]|nr:hypothetical protein EDC96DRAFT_491610 [Choanephora cucurbitarum]
MLLVYAIVAVFCFSQPIASAYGYFGDTPYQNQTFASTPLQIQRDLGANVTIDQLIWPTIDLSTAYFVRDYSSIQLHGIRSLLQMGYKRLVIDIYWSKSDWQLCPFPLNSVPDNYTCSTNATLSNFMFAVNDYLLSTDLNYAPMQTDLIFIVLNLHQIDNTTADAHLANIITQSISLPRLYTPANMTADQYDPNASFFANHSQPYFPIKKLQPASLWPQWLYLIQNEARLLVGFGTQPSNQTSYRLTSSDNNTIFSSQHTILSNPQVCPQNTSWAFVSDANQTPFTYSSAIKVTQCGYSPIFSHQNYSTSESIKSDVDSGHLADNILSSIWSWDVNEPNTAKVSKCAAMMLSNGRWRASDCAKEYRIACRLQDDPDAWLITQEAYNYDHSITACPADYTFDVPRIPRQNTLLKLLLDQQTDIQQDRIWINLNLAGSREPCWVIGRYGSCWWTDDDKDAFSGLIRTSIVSGVIVLIVVCIFMWVKCARLWRNRNSKTRKAAIKAMLAKRDYVTIPA